MGIALPIIPARLEFDSHGTPLSSAYGDIYHSSDGGLEQARHVFLGGNDLPQRWRGTRTFTVLETGFGLGLNFLATWEAWRKDEGRCDRLHYVSVEKHPFASHDLEVIHSRWPGLAPLSAELLRAWPPLTPGFHRLLLDAGRVTLTLLFGDAALMLPALVTQANAVYLDGFAPSRNPDLWAPEVLRRIGRLSAPGATLATWSVAANVREYLGKDGWVLDRAPGFGRKRDMLRGELRSRRPAPSFLKPMANERCALVVGAGIAGSAMAERLAVRDWRVTLLERQPGPALEASGNPAGLLHPVISSDDNLHARIVRAAHLYTLRLISTLDEEGHPMKWRAGGILQLARDALQETEQHRTCEILGFPHAYVRYVDRDEASTLAGAPVAAGAWFYPGGAWASPADLCRAVLQRHAHRISERYSSAVHALQSTPLGWRAIDATGNVLGEAPVVILANAHDIARLLPQCELPLTRLRGQVSLLPAGAIPDIRMALCGNGYVIPHVAGKHCFGATFDLNDDDTDVRPDSHGENLEHLRALLPSAETGAHVLREMEGRVGFRSAALDRLPLVGALPDPAAPLRWGAPLFKVPRLNGLHTLSALGSRGLVLAPLMAELLAAQLDGEPLPLERKLVDALDPARFLVRRQRQGEATHER